MHPNLQTLLSHPSRLPHLWTKPSPSCILLLVHDPVTLQLASAEETPRILGGPSDHPSHSLRSELWLVAFPGTPPPLYSFFQPSPLFRTETTRYEAGLPLHPSTQSAINCLRRYHEHDASFLPPQSLQRLRIYLWDVGVGSRRNRPWVG
ncbi:hypothetical protein JAAARDRAFT_346554 [Jaapia argillacea MUCL 33604]|uniref:Uncharacterized protein n=1 Tax=Jaapia argillacea MUCL 33604 TaxID=933084 RepID=A0A067PKC9_9AGAM|nr:hypothetical protein JAAARDRAFT_346554 [Jaapia argillacea MUCL 33604]